MAIQPLRPGDPHTLGRYTLLGLLGEGGMGAVYQARNPHGRLVAVKVVRPELAAVDEFRARFRSEVNRARQVPPFSTAAVLDADPEHRTPYLVVEYVDGPDLAQVVRERGPLSGGALHGLAVGVATALVAIHGAGVVHRDLKPRNVLFALGAPKVIDFGIARAVEATSEHTRTGQMVGTVAYMAPERLDGPVERVGPAVDVFAWGAVVAYAANGRSPFAGESTTATAVRILTGQPDLGGLAEPLRSIVARALAKDPAERPTAPELLEMLLADGTPPPRPRAPGAAVTGGPARSRPSRRTPVMIAAGVVAVLSVAAAVVFANGRDRSGLAAGPPSAAPSATARALVLADPLTAPGRWREQSAEGVSCWFDGGLVIEGMTAIDCPGPADVVAGDQSIAFTLRDRTGDACADVRFRVAAPGRFYLLEVCATTVDLMHYDGQGQAVIGNVTRMWPEGGTSRFTIEVTGDRATVAADGRHLMTATVDDPALSSGAISLGFRTFDDDVPSRVVFADLEVRAG